MPHKMKPNFYCEKTNKHREQTNAESGIGDQHGVHISHEQTVTIKTIKEESDTMSLKKQLGGMMCELFEIKMEKTIQ